MKSPALQEAWHHLARAQILTIEADDADHPPDKRRSLLTEARGHALAADAAIRQHLAQRPQAA